MSMMDITKGIFSIIIFMIIITYILTACEPLPTDVIPTPTPFETIQATPVPTPTPYVAPQLDYDKILDDIGNDNLNQMAVNDTNSSTKGLNLEDI